MLRRIWTSLKLLVCYFFPFLPCCPQIGQLENGDCVWVQAFGRNSMPDDDLGGTLWDILKRSSSTSETFILLKLSGFKPGKSNEALAKHAMKLAKKFDIPIIAQWEIVYCLWASDLRWFLDNQAKIDCLWPPELGYYATWHVKLESRERMRTRGLKRPIEICQPAMAARSVAIIWKLRVDVIVEAVHFWDFWKNPLWTWDPKSVQSWTTTFIKFRKIERWWPPKKFALEIKKSFNACWVFREHATRYAHHPIYRWISFWQPAPAHYNSSIALS